MEECDIKEIFRSLHLLHLAPITDKPVEIRIWLTDDAKTIYVGHFNDEERLLAEIEQWDRRDDVAGIFTLINPVRQSAFELEGRLKINNTMVKKAPAAKDTEIERRLRLLIDADPLKDSGKGKKASSTTEEKAMAKEAISYLKLRLEEQAWPEPIEGDSGNGYHLIYSIDLPNDEESKTLIKKFLHSLNLLLPQDLRGSVQIDEMVFNASRVSKLFGTAVRKGKDTRDRPWRRSHLIRAPDEIEVVPERKIRDIIELAGCSTAKSDSSSPQQVLKSHESIAGDEKLRPCLREIILDEENAWWPHQTRLAVTAELIYHGYSDEAIHHVLKKMDDYNPAISQKQISHCRTSFIGDGGKPWKCTSLTEEINGSAVVRPDLCRECTWKMERIRYIEKKENGRCILKSLTLAQDIIREKHLHVLNKSKNELAIYNEATGVYQRGDHVDRQILNEAISRLIAEGDKEASTLSNQEANRLKLLITGIAPEIDQNDFERERHLLCVGNGVVDLRTGELFPHSPEYYMCMATGVRYVLIGPSQKDEDGQFLTAETWQELAPRWCKVLSTIFDGDRDRIEFLQRYMGYIATGETKEDTILVLHGVGGTGKSTLLDSCRHVLGLYAVSIKSDLTKGASKGVRDGLAQAIFARLGIFKELSKDTMLDWDLIKEITSNSSVLELRELYGHFFQGKPLLKIVFDTNHRPVTEDPDRSIIRRLKLIPFNHIFTDKEADDNLYEYLIKHEAEGILRWIVEGAIKWYAKGLGNPSFLKEELRQYEAALDRYLLIAWFQQFIRIIHNGTLPRSEMQPTQDIFKMYYNYAQDSGVEPASIQEVSSFIEARGGRKAQVSIGKRQRMAWLNVQFSPKTDSEDKVNEPETLPKCEWCGREYPASDIQDPPGALLYLECQEMQDKTEHSPPQMERSPPNKLAEARPSLSEPALKDLLRNGTVTPERYSHETGCGVIEAMSQLDLACEAYGWIKERVGFQDVYKPA